MRLSPETPARRSEFQTGQIIYLQHEATRVYTETIQVVEPRQLCWARPLALLQSQGEQDPECKLYDLRQGSDLLLPVALFQVALDTDVIPVVTQLHTLKPEAIDSHLLAAQLLRQLIRQIWQAHPQEFSPSREIRD